MGRMSLLFSLLALQMAMPSYSGSTEYAKPECKEMKRDGENVRFVTHDCAGSRFYADGPRCDEIYGECPREVYRLEVEREGYTIFFLDIDGDMEMDDAIIIEKGGRKYHPTDKGYFGRQFRDYCTKLFGPPAFPSR
ncbi:MAG: hypothetical protein HY513_05550 [Candidatus Aenigmarchaeota archaeon]|nr:hypothetical protein [Candidatus Aenigmarchaeota archaeon]